MIKLVGLVCAALFFAACLAPKPDPNHLVLHLSAEPDLLNPILSTDAYASRIEGFLFDALLERDPETLKFRPKIAERWSVSPDHLSFIFYLRRDVRWHDGTPLTAHDVVFSYERIRDPKVLSPHLRGYYQDIESVKALDDHTVAFRFREPYFMALSFCGGIPIVPRHLLSADALDFNTSPFNRVPVGNGPYRFAEWKTGKRISLVRNADYYGPIPAFSEIEFRVIPDTAVSLMVLKKGGLDVVSLTPLQWLRQTQSPRFKKSFKKEKYSTPGYQFIGWNSRNSLFTDRRVRVALTHLVNREAIIDKLLFGLGKITTGPFFIRSPDYDPSVEPYAFDPVAARALFREAGWRDTDGDGWLDRDGKPFRFTITFASGSLVAERVATVVKEEFRKTGVDMQIEQMEWAVFVKRIHERDFDAAMLGWSMGVESDPYQVWHSASAKEGSNFIGFENAEADRLIETARREFDEEKRRQLFHAFHRLIHREEPYTFLFSTPALMARHRRFENVKIYPAGVEMIEWKVNSNWEQGL